MNTLSIKMPWTAKTFAKKHNHGLSPKQAGKAAKQATAMVKAGVDEGIAIATANKHAKNKPKKPRSERWYGDK